MIKVILFDADGVLIPKKWRFSQILESDYGVTLARSSEFFDGIFQECLIGQADLKESILPYLPKWGFKKSADEFLEYWFTSEHYLNEDLLKYIELLKKKNIKCFVATNNEIYRTKYMVDRMGFSSYFEQVFSSGTLGFKKPSKEFFQAILKALPSIKKKEMLFWDDSSENVEAAKKFGLQAEVYTNLADLKSKTSKYLAPKFPR